MYDGVVNCIVIMRVIFIDYVIYYMGRFFIGFVLVVVQYIYCEQYVLVYWFKVIMYIRKSMIYDN